MKNNNLKIKAAALAVATVLSVTALPTLAADAFNGVVKGTVSQQNDKALSGATITLKHKTKGITRKVTANEDGQYTLRRLPVGNYSVTIEKDGYQIAQEQSILVKLGTDFVLNSQLALLGTDIERIAVTGMSVSRIDLESATGGIVLTADDLKALPVEAGFENMALLSPGVTGNSAFGASSFGGSSSAENGYYLNGLNITSIKTGIGAIEMPWEAISQTSIQTGGVTADFGGALGGITNAVSKSGSNELAFGGYYRVDPNSLSEKHNNLKNSDDSIFTVTDDDEATFTRASLWASGAIIEDELFFYALYAPEKTDYQNAQEHSLSDGYSKSDKYFAKVDWYMNDDHSLEFTTIGFTDKGKAKQFDYDHETNNIGEHTGNTSFKTGGDIYGLKYSGILSDDISLEVIAGRTTEQVYNTVDNTDPLVWSKLSGSWDKISNESASGIIDAEFIRDQFRADIDWEFDDHSLKFGIDYTKISVDFVAAPNGVGDRAGWWNVNYVGEGHRSGAPVGTAIVDQRVRTDFSDSDATGTAIYITDTWQATDDLVLNLGVRVSNVANTVSDGRKYIDVKNQIAPRLQANYDLFGDGSTKVFATFGRYFQPVSANMNITQGGSRSDVHDYYLVGDLDANGEVVLLPDGSPSTGAYVSSSVVSDGSSEPEAIASKTMKSMYNDEFTLGFLQEIMDGDMSWGMRAVYRDLKRAIEDTDYAPAINKWYEANGQDPSASYVYVLANPGSTLDITGDFNGDGTVENVVIPGSEIALQNAERTYAALETTLSGNATDKLYIRTSYTWSHGWGNTEGLVKTDNGQADPGWTTSYDYADLMDHGYGNLPNDRRHSFRLSGTYEFTDNLILGFVGKVDSGAPISKLGLHPSGVDSCAPGSIWDSCSSQDYGHTSFYDENGNPSPRGTAGRTDWTKELDLSLSYRLDVSGHDLHLKGTVYNVFNADTQASVNQTRTQNGENGLEVNPNWGNTVSRIDPRVVSLEARFTF